ncbi:MAG: tRNA epoxyqueuosine(34) reductase QueG [Myxococcales bacterium]|nr:tRNA epoxyqueuosine(34) reductase QueG [Myxococcales bacterium]
MRSTSPSFTELLIERAAELGFQACGVVPIDVPLRIEAFDGWLADGLHGEMAYMERHRDLRANPGALHPGSRSVVTVAASYCPDSDRHSRGGIARYARGMDYHKRLRKQLVKLGQFIQSEIGQSPVPPRPFVDSAPVMERDMAASAGLGWVGKSTNVLSQELGSYLFLGELFVASELAPTLKQAPDRCGRCTACIDECPTGAIVEPYVVDARRCISYLTIELSGPIPRTLRPAIGDHLFGCDICQSVCPWNRKAVATPLSVFRPRPEILGLSALDLLTMTDSEFELISRGSPIRRPGRAGMARNSAVVLGNSGDRQCIPPLVGALRGDSAAVVRGHAAWALGRLGGAVSRSALEMALVAEDDESVRAEIRDALEEC